jgi:iron complex transport system permease protein
MKQSRSQVTLLLAGITVSFICSALIVLVLFLAGRHDLAVIVQWMMGSVEVFGFNPIWETLAFSVLAFGLTIYLHRDLDLLMTGESLAASRGVPVRRVRMLVFMAGSLLTASVVAHCGPIGFIGLMVPHIARAIVGPVHRYLIPAAALTGAALLPLCDVIARNALYWLRAESRPLPVGVLTNVLGGLFFLYLLLRRQRSSTAFSG